MTRTEVRNRVKFGPCLPTVQEAAFAIALSDTFIPKAEMKRKTTVIYWTMSREHLEPQFAIISIENK